jgi:hypothetical protein
MTLEALPAHLSAGTTGTASGEPSLHFVRIKKRGARRETGVFNTLDERGTS